MALMKRVTGALRKEKRRLVRAAAEILLLSLLSRKEEKEFPE